MELFTRNVKKIKGAAHKNRDIEGTCKIGLKYLCETTCYNILYSTRKKFLGFFCGTITTLASPIKGLIYTGCHKQMGLIHLYTSHQ